MLSVELDDRNANPLAVYHSSVDISLHSSVDISLHSSVDISLLLSMACRLMYWSAYQVWGEQQKVSQCLEAKTDLFFYLHRLSLLRIL